MRTKVDLHTPPCFNKTKSKNECYAWTSVFLLEPNIDINNKYYPVLFSNECKYIVNKQDIKIRSENLNNYL